jgi:2-deoxy-D-gluconate 3-dehydrogenase
VIALTKWLAVYLAPKGIRVNCLIPGGVFNNQDVGFVKMYEDRTPMGRMAEANEIGEAVVYLATSSYMTGANLIVDGGFTAW